MSAMSLSTFVLTDDCLLWFLFVLFDFWFYSRGHGFWMVLASGARAKVVLFPASSFHVRFPLGVHCSCTRLGCARGIVGAAGNGNCPKIKRRETKRNRTALAPKLCHSSHRPLLSKNFESHDWLRLSQNSVTWSFKYHEYSLRHAMAHLANSKCVLWRSPHPIYRKCLLRSKQVFHQLWAPKGLQSGHPIKFCDFVTRGHWGRRASNYSQSTKHVPAIFVFESMLVNQLEYFLQGSVEEKSLHTLLDRLKGLCDNAPERQGKFVEIQSV